MDSNKILHYADNRTKYVSKGKGADFRRAVKEMDEYISDKKVNITICFHYFEFIIKAKQMFQKYRSHAFVKPVNNHIKIKTERDIQQQLGIKIENQDSYACNNTSQMKHTTPTSTNNAEFFLNEKKKLIDNIMSLKTENQTFVQKLNEKDAQLIESEEKITALNLMIDELKTKLRDSIQANEECASSLKRENAVLLAQNKQLSTALSQTENVESDVYEVESLLDHKQVQETHYLVHWKGYDETHNTWERESNLHCSSILKKYKKLKKISKY